jgi:tryptophan synthase alpha subunit
MLHPPALGKVADAVVIGTKIIQVISDMPYEKSSQCEEFCAKFVQLWMK